MNLSINYFRTIIFLFCFSQTAKAQSLIQYIPGDAPVVMSFNFDQLNKKVSLDELKQFDFYKAMLKELRQEGETVAEKEFMNKFMDTPSALGYDMLQPMHFFMQEEDGVTYFTILMKMGDRAKYETGLKDFKTNNYEGNLKNFGNFKYWSHNDETFAWSDEVIINVWAVDDAQYSGFLDTTPDDFNWEEMEPIEETEYGDFPVEEEIMTEENDTMPSTSNDLGNDPGIEDTVNNYLDADRNADMENYVKKIINKESSSFLSSHPTYQSAVGETRSDVHFWMDYIYFLNAMKDENAVNGIIGSDAAMLMERFNHVIDIFSYTHLSMGLNFQDGKMAIRSEMFVNKDMEQFYKNAMDAKLNKKLLRYVEGGDKLFGYYFLNFNIKKSIDEGKVLMHKILKATPEYGLMADDAMKILGIFIDEDAIGDLMKGDLLLAVSGMKMMEVNETIYDYDDDFNFIQKDTIVVKKQPIVTMLASYGNEKDIMKFVDLGLHSKVIEKEGDHYKMTIPDMGTNVYMAMKKGVMVFTNDKNLVTHKLERGYKKKERLGKKHRKLMCKNSMAFYFDIPNTLYAISGDGSSPGDPITGYLDMFARQFNNLEMTSSKTVENSLKSQFNFNFTNKGTNSLEQFFNFVNDLYIEFLGGARI